MIRTSRSNNTVSIPKSVLSVKIFSILLVGLLVAGTVPVTHSYPSAKADFNNIWLAAKEFWDSLQFFKSQQQIDRDQVAEETFVSTKDDMMTEVLNQGLEKLKKHPECRSIYVSEYLPTFNSHVIEKCEKAIKQHEQKHLFDTYIKQLCSNVTESSLARQQIGEIQLRLRKYSLTFPQSNIKIAESDIDGIYGTKTCETVASYQIISQFDSINGIADQHLYNDLVAAIPLSETELASLNWKAKKKRALAAKKEKASTKVAAAEPNYELPTNPFKRIAFCIRNSHIKQCKYSARGIEIAKADINHK